MVCVKLNWINQCDEAVCRRERPFQGQGFPAFPILRGVALGWVETAFQAEKPASCPIAVRLSAQRVAYDRRGRTISPRQRSGNACASN